MAINDDDGNTNTVKRWHAEGFFSGVKRKCGEYVSATRKENIYHEVKLKFLFYSALIKYE